MIGARLFSRTPFASPTQAGLLCLSCYDWPGTFGARQWLPIARAFFDALRCVPTRCVVLADRGLRSRSYAYQRLDSVDCDDIEALTLMVEDDIGGTALRRWRIAARFSNQPLRQRKSYTFAFENAGGEGEPGSLLDSVLAQLSRHNALGNGMAFRWTLGTDPLFYATGIAYSRERVHRSEVREVSAPTYYPSAWDVQLRPPDRAHLHGKFRDLYPWNFVLPSHREAPIGPLTLEQAIAQDPQWGTLRALNDHVSLWEVADTQRARIREALGSHGLLI